jgi:hypothetical protein
MPPSCQGLRAGRGDEPIAGSARLKIIELAPGWGQ